RLRPPTREGPTDRSLTGAPRHEGRGATSCCRLKSPGLSEAAGLTRAVERPACKAVLGEAPEDLELRVPDFARGRDFSPLTIGGCPSERVRARVRVRVRPA